MSSILRWAICALGGSKQRSIRAKSSIVSEDRLIDEESMPNYVPQRYYPVSLGEVFNKRYEVLVKLGYGRSSTVWLAQDLLRWKRHVALKLLTNEALSQSGHCMEIEVSKRIKKAAKQHWVLKYVRCVTDFFEIDGPDGKHTCLVYKPLREDLYTFQYYLNGCTLKTSKVKSILRFLLFELEFLHRHCHVIHTDIRAQNILFEFGEVGEIDSYLKDDAEDPLPHKVVSGRMLFMSRPLSRPEYLGRPVLTDFGHARFGEVEHSSRIQPDAYRAPEVILEGEWDYSVDIWNVWDIFEEKPLFQPMHKGKNDTEEHYSELHHLAEIQARIGSPPVEFHMNYPLGARLHHKGSWLGGLKLNDASTLEISEQRLEGDEKKLFLEFMTKMLQWLPEKRSTAQQLLDDPWLNSPSNDKEGCAFPNPPSESDT